MNPAPMPEDDRDPTCERTVASLLLFSDTLSAEELEARIGAAPTQTLKKGRKTLLESGRERIDPHHAFFLESEDHVDSKDLRRHVDWILERVGGRAAAFRDLWREGEAWGWLSCIWWSAEGHGGPLLRADQLAAIAELDLELSFGFSYYGGEES